MENDALQRLLDDLDWSRPNAAQEQAIEELARYGSGMFPSLEARFVKKNMRNIVRVVRRVDEPGHADAIPMLLQYLMDLTWPGAPEAFGMLREMGVPIVSAVRRVMREHASDEMWMVGICHLIEEMEPGVTTALVPELLSLVRSEAEAQDVDWSALGPLDRIGGRSVEAAVDFLVRRAGDGTLPTQLRLRALEGLHELQGPDARTAVLQLGRCLDDMPDIVRRHAQEVISRAHASEAGGTHMEDRPSHPLG